MELLKILEEIDPQKEIDNNKILKTINYLKKKKKVLFLTTSNRGEWVEKNLKETPKSTQLAYKIKEIVGDNICEIIEIPKLKIYPCEGNVSHKDGNSCGVKEAILKNKQKNPTGNHRCWRNINNSDDELWKITKKLFESEVLIIFGSIRWGQTNTFYQNLIERLTWLENRHSSLGESNLLKNIEAGVIFVGQNWNGLEVLKTQKQVLGFYGFDVKNILCWNWQFTKNSNDESKKSYKNSYKKFKTDFNI